MTYMLKNRISVETCPSYHLDVHAVGGEHRVFVIKLLKLYDFVNVLYFVPVF